MKTILAVFALVLALAACGCDTEPEREFRIEVESVTFLTELGSREFVPGVDADWDSARVILRIHRVELEGIGQEVTHHGADLYYMPGFAEPTVPEYFSLGDRGWV